MTSFWELFVATVLGAVEGLTEFAPVSSTGHMVLVDDLLLRSKDLFSPEVANTFKVMIQLGSILAVAVVFRKRFLSLLGLSRSRQLELTPSGVPHRLALRHVFVGLLPAAILGFLFADFIDQYLFSVPTVLVALVLGAFLMIAADWFRPSKPSIESVDQITMSKAFAIGTIQCVSLWPGFSRSGSTISAGVLLGLSHRAASDFSFIMAVPIMLGASSLSLAKHWHIITLQTLPFFLVGFISAFLCGLLTIHFFLKVINKIKLVPFAIYRLILAAILAIILFL